MQWFFFKIWFNINVGWISGFMYHNCRLISSTFKSNSVYHIWCAIEMVQRNWSSGQKVSGIDEWNFKDPFHNLCCNGKQSADCYLAFIFPTFHIGYSSISNLSNVKNPQTESTNWVMGFSSTGSPIFIRLFSLKSRGSMSAACSMTASIMLSLLRMPGDRVVISAGRNNNFRLGGRNWQKLNERAERAVLLTRV